MTYSDGSAEGRPTIVDLAKAAGVSISTVDRVLNGRHPVRQVTADRVLEAAERIGFRGLAAIRHRVANSRPVGRLGFLLQLPAQQEYRMWGQLLADATRSSSLIHGRPVVRFMDNLSPENVIDNLIALSREADAVALVAADHAKINHAVDMIAADGMPIFTLVSELSAQGTTGHVGIDNLKKGRTAAWFVQRLARDVRRVAVLVGSPRYISQDLAEAGFRTYLREHAPSAEIMQTEATFEEDQIAHRVMAKLLNEASDLSGVYVAGGGIGGVIAALREHRFSRPKPLVILNESTDETRAALADGIIEVVLSNPPTRLAQTAVEIMARSLTGQLEGARRQHILPFDIYTPENV